MTPTEARLRRDPNFIVSKRFRYSLERLERRYPDECPDHIAAMVLGITTEQLEVEYGLVVEKLRCFMGANR